METIDIRRLIKNKNPKLSRWVPNFLIRWIERLIRLEKINHVLSTYGEQEPLEFIRSTLDYIGVTYSVHGPENIPDDRRVIFASNHPLGGLDGLILAEAVAPFVPSVKLIVNDLLMYLEPLAPIFAPVNKFGSQNSEYARRITEMYASDTAVITFPAGLCSRLIGKEIRDLPWHRNFVSKAWNSNRMIVPVFIEGANSRFFYQLANLRKKLGIKMNIEMLWLPKEMFDQKGKHIDIYFGEPVEITREHSGKEWAKQIQKTVSAMKPARNNRKTQ